MCDVIATITTLPNISHHMCNALTSKGTRCKNKGAGFCRFHSRMAAEPTPIVMEPRGSCTNTTLQKNACKNKEMRAGCGYCFRHAPDDVSEDRCCKMLQNGSILRRCRNVKVESDTLYCHMHVTASGSTTETKEVKETKEAKETKDKKETKSKESKQQLRPATHSSSSSLQTAVIVRIRCHAYTDGVRCAHMAQTDSREHKFCATHARVYRLDKPDTCGICTEIIDETKEQPLSCGHWSHIVCLRKWNKPICPFCRTAMTTEEKSKIIIDYTVLSNIMNLFGRLFYAVAIDTDVALSDAPPEIMLTVINWLNENIDLYEFEQNPFSMFLFRDNISSISRNIRTLMNSRSFSLIQNA